jgi:hypothetical protein
VDASEKGVLIHKKGGLIHGLTPLKGGVIHVD